MKRIKIMLAACCLLGSLLAAAPVAAADASLPNVDEPSAQTIAAQGLQKDALCTKCHDESETAPVLSIYQTQHGVRGDARTPTCQSCHGASADHLKGSTSGAATRPLPDVVFKKGVYPASDERERASACLACHKGGKHSNWDGAAHQNNGVVCNDCHVVHRARDKLFDRRTQAEVCFSCHKDQRTDGKKISHHPVAEGKVSCSDCHNPHGSTGPKLLKKNTVTETCFQCHAEKRGPLLWEHQPVAEDCTHCHTPHGSNISPLLKSRAPFLCQECHDGPHNSKTPYAGSVAGLQGGLRGTATAPANPGSNQTGRACMNCHVMVHGSNSPAGALLQR